jgi:uncharacterized cupin superfamily protein
MNEITERPPIVRAGERTRENEMSSGHPMNPNAEMFGHALSRVVGLMRVGLWSVRLPPGKESFVYHRHHLEEEFLYVLSGRGVVEIEGTEHEIGPGDFVGFRPGVAHGLKNPFEEDLCYLSGGERHEMEIADYPRHGMRGVRLGDRMDLYPIDSAEAFPGVKRI